MEEAGKLERPTTVRSQRIPYLGPGLVTPMPAANHCFGRDRTATEGAYLSKVPYCKIGDTLGRAALVEEGKQPDLFFLITCIIRIGESALPSYAHTST